MARWLKYHELSRISVIPDLDAIESAWVLVHLIVQDGITS